MRHDLKENCLIFIICFIALFIKGTKGCIGLSALDAPVFWSNWMNMALNARPQNLIVT